MVGNQREGLAKRLTDVEFQAKREKGLCFRCDKCYTTGHCCKARDQRELRIPVVTEKEEDLEGIEDIEQGEEQVELKTIKVVVKVQTVAQLSINSVVGLINPRTMKVKGKIQNEWVIVFINCGASHNFIAERLASLLQLPVIETSNYGVILGSGSAVNGKGVCNLIELAIGELTLRR